MRNRGKERREGMGEESKREREEEEVVKKRKREEKLTSCEYI